MKRTGTGYGEPGIPTIGKKLLLDLQEYLAGFPYSFLIMTKKGPNLDELSHLGAHSVNVYLSRFPNLLKIEVVF